MSPRSCGTYVRYVVDRCRCDDCRAANRAYEARRRRRQVEASWGAAEPLLVDAAPARAHIAVLAAYGLGAKQIAAAAGVSRTVIARLHGWSNGEHCYRPAARVRPDTLRKILAVQPIPQNCSPDARIDALGSGRKLQALAAAGWSQAELGRRLGISPANMTAVMRLQPGDRISARRWLAIDRLWRDLGMTPGPSARSVRIAAGKGWAPPLAWDDIDNPDDTPHTAGDGRAGFISEMVDDLTGVGLTRAEAVARVAQVRGISLADADYADLRRRQRRAAS